MVAHFGIENSNWLTKDNTEGIKEEFFIAFFVKKFITENIFFPSSYVCVVTESIASNAEKK
jgi:hypothetical protein